MNFCCGMIEFLYPTPSPKFFFIQYISAYCKADTSFLVSNILKVASTVCSLYVFNRLTVWPTDRPTNGHGRPTDQRTRPTDRADQLTKRHGRPKRLTDYLTGWLSTDRMTDRLLPTTAGIWHLLSCCCISPAYSSQMPPVLSVQIRICLSPAYKRNKKTIF